MLSAVSVLVVAQSSSEIPEGLMNNPVQSTNCICVRKAGRSRGGDKDIAVSGL